MSTTTFKAREDLKSAREQLKALRAERGDAAKEVEAARESFTMPTDGQKITEMAEYQAVEEAVRKQATIDETIRDREDFEKHILGLLGLESEASGAGNHQSMEGRPQGGYKMWSGHDLLASSDEFKSAREQGLFASTGRFGTINLGEIADRETFLAALPNGSVTNAPPGSVGTPAPGAWFVPPDFRGVIPPALKRLSLLDLIPTGTTDSNMISYVQVLAIPAGSVETAELAAKPETGLTTIDATAPVRTIAGWIKMARQAMEDVAGLGTLINTLLPYDVRRRIEQQILVGDGAGQNLKGLLYTSGVGIADFVATDNPADAILRAMTVIILSDSDPNFVTLNPITWQNLLLMREGTNPGASGTSTPWTGEYLYGSPGMLQSPHIWGLTITTNRLIPVTKPVVGDSMGCSLLVREGVNVKTSDSDQDDFIRNRVTVLAEARVAFPVWRPSAFAIANLSAGNTVPGASGPTGPT